MLIKEGAEKISKLDYPNFWHQGNLKLRLSYQFEPGADADGVTVHIPLPLLNQVEESGFEWQIPGLRRELVIALIKSLPKPVRRNFVPAPNYAEAFVGRVTPLELPLLDSLERELRRMTGVTVDREDWHWDQGARSPENNLPRGGRQKQEAKRRALATRSERCAERQSAGNAVCGGG